MTGLEAVGLATGEESLLTAGTLVLASGRLPEMVIAQAAAGENQVEEAETEAEGPLRWVGMSPYKEPAFRTEARLVRQRGLVHGFQRCH